MHEVHNSSIVMTHESKTTVGCPSQRSLLWIWALYLLGRGDGFHKCRIEMSIRRKTICMLNTCNGDRSDKRGKIRLLAANWPHHREPIDVASSYGSVSNIPAAHVTVCSLTAHVTVCRCLKDWSCIVLQVLHILLHLPTVCCETVRVFTLEQPGDCPARLKTTF